MLYQFSITRLAGKSFTFLLLFFSIHSAAIVADSWVAEKHKQYMLYYQSPDLTNKDIYIPFFEDGIKDVEHFFNAPFKKEFNIYIHPNRPSLDRQWQNDWNMPGFKSECWMVASGVAAKLDIISPVTWEKNSCEHVFKDTIKTSALITHELFHVFHGQVNNSPDFSDVDSLDWFVEGLATYASGQCDSSRMAAVSKLIAEKKYPLSLNEFWTGKNKYGLAGSVVMYIDRHYGREKLKSLLVENKKYKVLSALNISETELIFNWANFISKN